MYYQKSICIQRFLFWYESCFTCHIAFFQTNKDDLPAPRTFNRASFRNIKSYFSSIEHSKNKLKIRIFNTRVKPAYLLFKLVRWVSSSSNSLLFASPSKFFSWGFFIFSIQHLRCLSGHYSHHSLLFNKSVVVVLTLFSFFAFPNATNALSDASIV